MSDPLEKSNEGSGIVDKIKNFFSGLGGSAGQGESLRMDDRIGETIKEEGRMVSDPLGKITEGEDLIGKVRNFLAGFVGYVDRENRREADKLLRETIAQRYEEQWNRISELQRQLISEGQLELVDDLEAATIKLRAFVDRVKGASYGYAGFFDAVRIHSDELEKVYQYDIALLEGAQNIANAVDNVATSFGSDGLPAAIRHLISLSQEAVDAYNRRDEVILTTGS
ncbi:MAG: hypothetical protein AMJ88_00670 [Anaerolineae bacterium SM23_ 63]|nr:MAG: hypothetical protein AMJ88_00670 [Anaerolineae bacterium SM23_ 63]HEY45757.1 hypothetical protein [Anaerolineae bacterium]